jgi:hypothetical protein
MSTRSFAETLNEIADKARRPRINVSLADRNRVSLVNWDFADDCLVDSWPNGKPRLVIPLAAIVMVEILESESG